MFCKGSLEDKIDKNAKTEPAKVVMTITFLRSYRSEKYPIGAWPITPEIVAINRRIEVSKSEFSLGEIELNKDFEVKLQVKNAGAQSLSIISAQAGCGCVREKGKLTIQPGTSSELILYVRAKEEGAFTINAIVETNDPQNRYLPLKVSFVGKKSLTQDGIMFSQPGQGF